MGDVFSLGGFFPHVGWTSAGFLRRLLKSASGLTAPTDYVKTKVS